MTYSHVEVAQIAAIGKNNAIGKDNAMPWYLPADLKHFKRLTEGGIVIMGRKTFESIGKPLPNRTHIIISRNLEYQVPPADEVIVLHNFDEAISQAASLAHAKGLSTIWVIGGQAIFERAMLFTDRLEITHIEADFADADTFYPAIEDDFVPVAQSEIQTDSQSGLSFYFTTYQRKAD